MAAAVATFFGCADAAGKVAVVSGALLAVAMALDGALGEPRLLWDRLPHPAVVMGRAVDGLDRTLNSGERRRLKGVLATATLAGGATLLGIALEAIPLIGDALSVTVAAILLAQRSLAEHVRAVAEGLDRSLAEGRGAVAMIVGRDVQALDEVGVARAAIESCAENFSDGVVAPAFWYLIAGAPGILVYKTINTADSMIGHRTPRHAAFGWAAARLDDGLNLIPARLSALLLAAAAWSRAALVVTLSDARKHRSPNAGWPEAAVAGALGVALSGPRSYHGRMTDDPFVNAAGRRELRADDVRRAVALIWRAWGIGLAAVAAASLPQLL